MYSMPMSTLLPSCSSTDRPSELGGKTAVDGSGGGAVDLKCIGVRRVIGDSTQWHSLTWSALSCSSGRPSSLTFLPLVNRVIGGRPNERSTGAKNERKPVRTKSRRNMCE